MKIREMSDRQRDRQTGMTTILVEYFFFSRSQKLYVEEPLGRWTFNTYLGLAYLNNWIGR